MPVANPSDAENTPAGGGQDRMSARRPRVLFLYLPYDQLNSRLDTMPFAFNSLKMLVRDGVDVTLCLWEPRRESYDTLARNGTLTVRYFVERPAKFVARLALWTFAAQVMAAARGRFDYIFAVGQRGIAVAGFVQRRFRSRLVYYNDEFPSVWGVGRWSREERAAAARAEVIVVPDECRAEPLLDELGLMGKVPSAALPNAPHVEYTSIREDWHARFGIPRDRRIILHAGSVADWAQIPETLCTIRNWPGDAVLLIHSRGGPGFESYRASMQHLLEQDGRVFWNAEPVSEAELSALIAACFCTLGLYRNTCPNFEHIGMSSGKIMRSVVSGVPVIASRLGSLRFVAEHGLGVTIRSPHEIPAALEEIARRRDEIRENCRVFAASCLNFPEKWDAFWSALTSDGGEAGAFPTIRPARHITGAGARLPLGATTDYQPAK